jgi:hypothetical protein
MEMSYEAYAMIGLAKLKMPQSSYCSMLKLISSFKTIFLEFRNMNNQKRCFIALCATLLWSVNFVIATGIKGHIPPVGMAFGDGQYVVLAPLP